MGRHTARGLHVYCMYYTIRTYVYVYVYDTVRNVYVNSYTEVSGLICMYNACAMRTRDMSNTWWLKRMPFQFQHQNGESELEVHSTTTCGTEGACVKY